MKHYSLTLGPGPTEVKPIVHRYKRGAIIKWKTEKLVRAKPAKRGEIMDASKSSLRYCGFLLENSSAEWEVMITLTFRVEHTNPKRAFREWQRRRAWCDTRAFNFAWFMEFQDRGVVHLHYFLGSDALAAHLKPFPGHWETLYRGEPAQRVDLLRGLGELSLVDSWVDCVGDPSPSFLAFQHGGIIERLHSRQGAARYAASYATKQKQKQLPPGQAPLGRWWFISQKATPRPEQISPLVSYPFENHLKLLWDGSLIQTEQDIIDNESKTNRS